MTEFSAGPVLVSGGAGYIGSHVVHALKTAGWTPIVIDDLGNGHNFAADLAPVFHRGEDGSIHTSVSLIKLSHTFEQGWAQLGPSHGLLLVFEVSACHNQFVAEDLLGVCYRLAFQIVVDVFLMIVVRR